MADSRAGQGGSRLRHIHGEGCIYTYPDCDDESLDRYALLRDELASALCTDATYRGEVIGEPCASCRDAANRIVVKRRSVRQVLTRFARKEANLDV